MGREIRRDTKGMNKSEQEAYLKKYMGWEDDPEDDSPWPDCDPDREPFVINICQQWMCRSVRLAQAVAITYKMQVQQPTKLFCNSLHFYFAIFCKKVLQKTLFPLLQNLSQHLSVYFQRFSQTISVNSPEQDLD